MRLPIYVDTFEYMRSHGREPRGRGSWAFSFDRSDEVVWAQGGLSMTFADARKWAVRVAKETGASVVRVLS
jgi:hypothetical protein